MTTYRIVLFSLLALVVGAFLPKTWAQEASGPRTQFLIKQDGTMLEGIINIAGGYYTVEVANGRGFLYVRKEQAFKVVDTVAEAYQERIKTMVYQDAREYLSLADWCIQNQLYPQAQQALNSAQAQQNGHPMIKVYQRRLDLAQEQALKEAQRMQKEAQQGESRAAEAGVMASANGAIGTSATDPAGKTALNPEEEASRRIILQQRALDQMAGNMPGDTLKQFTSEIQPLLQRGCGTLNCHGAQTTSDFQIIPSANKARNLTLRNLYSVLRQVDRENPQDSPLLTKAVEAHGDLDVPIFTRSRASAYSRLVGWTYRVTRPARIYSVEQTQYLDQTIGKNVKRNGEELVNPFEQAFWEEASTAESGGTEKTEKAQGREKNQDQAGRMDDQETGVQKKDDQKTGVQIQRGNPVPQTYEAMDPFDPNTFNQLQAGAVNSAVGSAVVPPDTGAGLTPGTSIQSAIQPGSSGSAVVEFKPNGCETTSRQTAAVPFANPGFASGSAVSRDSFSRPESAKDSGRVLNNVPQSSVISAPGTFGGVNNSPGKLMTQPNYGIEPGPQSAQFMQTPAQQALQQRFLPPTDDEPITIIRNGKIISGSAPLTTSMESEPQLETPASSPSADAPRPKRKYSTSESDAGYDELPRVDLLFGGK